MENTKNESSNFVKVEKDIRLVQGTIVSHFKRLNYITKCIKEGKDYDDNVYLYEVVGVGKNTETEEKYVIYKAIYNSKEFGVKFGDIFVRPYDMFLSKVDMIKYPNIVQEYRFEPYTF